MLQCYIEENQKVKFSMHVSTQILQGGIHHADDHLVIASDANERKKRFHDSVLVEIAACRALHSSAYA